MATYDLEELASTARLRGDLALLRRLLDQKGEPFYRVKTLRRAAQLLCPCERDATSIRELIQLAISRSFGATTAGEAAERLYGLTDDSFSQSLRRRRELACEKWGADSYQTFRTGPEEEILDELANALRDLLLDPGAAESTRGRSGALAPPATSTRSAPSPLPPTGDQGLRRRYQVFISSTYDDLLEERDTVIRTILRSQNIPFSYEIAMGVNDPTVAVLRDWIRQCDFFILLLGTRCGSLDPATGASYTSLEYDYAKEIGKPIAVIWLRHPSAQHDRSSPEETEMAQKQQAAFIQRVTTNDFCVPVDSAADLEPRTLAALSNLSERHPQGGWVRANSLDLTALNTYTEYVNMCMDITLTNDFSVSRLERLLRCTQVAISRWFRNELGWLDVVVPLQPAKTDGRLLLSDDIPTAETWLTVLLSGMKRTKPPTMIPTVVNDVPWRGSGNAFVSGGLDYVGSFQGLFRDSYGLSLDVLAKIEKQYSEWRDDHYFASLLAIAIASDDGKAKGVLNLNFKCEHALDSHDNLAPEESEAVVKMLEPLLRVLATALTQDGTLTEGLR